MEQKDYNMEILSVLLREKSHIRDIAKKLNTNHMMVSRKLKGLLDKNIVDFSAEGRNQIYLLKDSPEARIFILMAEHYKLFKFIRKYPALREIINRMQKDKRINLAVIFGSYVKDMVRKQSDIDIFIESSDKNIKQRYSEIDSKLNIKTGNLGEDVLSQEIKKNHIIVRGGEIYYDRFFS